MIFNLGGRGILCSSKVNGNLPFNAHECEMQSRIPRLTPAKCPQKHYNRVGEGHVYQGRFKSFPVEDSDYFYRVNRYVERNALRAQMVLRAEDWQYGSLWIHQFGTAEHRSMLSRWPMPRPRSWLQYVNEPETEAELKALRNSCLRGTPYGSSEWMEHTAKALDLHSTLRLPGRPKKD